MKLMELKPCPFCGSRVKMIKGIIRGTNTVMCDKCGADVMFFGADNNVDKFIKKWNSRVENKGHEID